MQANQEKETVMLRLPAVESGTDEELIQHLEDYHPSSLLFEFRPEPHRVGQPRRLHNRTMLEAYHAIQHKNNELDHVHRERAEVPAGKSILEMLWESLDTVMERLMTGAVAEDGQDVGMARGIALSIAIMTNPYAPSIDAIREEAMERWSDAHPDEDGS